MYSLWEVTKALWDGFQTTLSLFGLTLLFALPIGLILSFGSMSKFKPLAYLVKIFVWIIRGTPLMLQIMIVFYVPGLVFNNPIFSGHRFLAALITFVINYSCYFSEIYRGGIESIPRGQYEAGQLVFKKPIFSGHRFIAALFTFGINYSCYFSALLPRRN